LPIKTNQQRQKAAPENRKPASKYQGLHENGKAIANATSNSKLEILKAASKSTVSRSIHKLKHLAVN